MQRVIPTLLLVLATSLTALAQSPHFVNTNLTPYGPGDRSFDITVKLVGGETTANTQVWVLYSHSEEAVAGAKLGSSVPQGRAKLGAVNSSAEVKAQFIFPHRRHPRPNVTDRNEKSYSADTRIHYKVIKKSGANEYESTAGSFVMPDKLTIVNFGDSYASGEGAPYSDGPDWDDEEYAALCHRNSNSGQARAVAAIKRENPALAIAFLNVACSGAEIAEGLLQSQKKKTWFGEGEVHQTPVPPQLNQTAEWLDRYNRPELNIAIVSGGGNDVGFGTYVADFYVGLGNFGGDREAQQNLETTIAADIPNLYNALKSGLDRLFDYDAVLVTEYPDPTRNKNGAFCGAADLGLCWPHDIVLNPQDEYRAIYNSFLNKINTTIRSTVSSFPNWTYVGGTMQASARNGLCNCDEPYFNGHIATSIWEQGDVYGIVHPNRRGHRMMYEPVVKAALDRAIRTIRGKYPKSAPARLALNRMNTKIKSVSTSARLQILQSAAQTVTTSQKRVVAKSATIDPAIIARARAMAKDVKRIDVGQDNRRSNDDDE